MYVLDCWYSILTLIFRKVMYVAIRVRCGELLYDDFATNILPSL